MQSIRLEGKRRFCSRIEFGHPTLVVKFSHDTHPRRHESRGDVAPPMQLKINLNALQVNLWTYFTISNITMWQRLITVRTHLDRSRSQLKP